MKPVIQKSALVLLGMMVAALVSGCGQPHILTFKALVDGSDVVKVSGNRLWIEHEDYSLPTQISVNGKPWRPVWTDKTSEQYQGLSPAFNPHDPMNVKLTQLKGRGSVSILQLPNSANDQTLTFRIDDNDFGGADIYEIRVNW
jgi:hypothetical protein